MTSWTPHARRTRSGSGTTSARRRRDLPDGSSAPSQQLSGRTSPFEGGQLSHRRPRTRPARRSSRPVPSRHCTLGGALPLVTGFSHGSLVTTAIGLLALIITLAAIRVAREDMSGVDPLAASAVCRSRRPAYQREHQHDRRGHRAGRSPAAARGPCDGSPPGDTAGGRPAYDCHSSGTLGRAGQAIDGPGTATRQVTGHHRIMVIRRTRQRGMGWDSGDTRLYRAGDRQPGAIGARRPAGSPHPGHRRSAASDPARAGRGPRSSRSARNLSAGTGLTER